MAAIESAGLFKRERIITSEQGAEITVSTATGSKQVLNFCANNYLGLSSHPEVVKAAHATLDSHGFGMSSVRFMSTHTHGQFGSPWFFANGGALMLYFLRRRRHHHQACKVAGHVPGRRFVCPASCCGRSMPKRSCW